MLSHGPGGNGEVGAARCKARRLAPPSHLRAKPFQADPEPVATHRRGESAPGGGTGQRTEAGRERVASPAPGGRPAAGLSPPGRLRGPHQFTSQRFHALLNSLFKVLFNFPSRYLSAIGLAPVFSLRWSLPPALGCIRKQPDSEETVPRGDGGRYRPHTVHGLSLYQKDSGPRSTPGRRPSPVRHISRARGGRGFGAGLFPLRSPLLRESLLVSFPPLSNMLKFSGYSRLI